MTKTLHAVFDGKVLRPEETVDLEPDTSYIVTVNKKDSLESQNLWSVLSDLAGKVEGPSDWSEEHDHYLYGTPKQKQG
ncbi:MAG: hypothetical protein QME07_01365 [bacterium]|nr:hypothetical protein [bacterium]